jgi:hypothetical protein
VAQGTERHQHDHGVRFGNRNGAATPLARLQILFGWALATLFSGIVVDVEATGHRLRARCATWLDVRGTVPAVQFQRRCNYRVFDLVRHCDAYLVSGVDGKFGVRLVRDPAGDETTLEESNLTEEPSIEVDTCAGTVNQTVVKFTDRAKDLIEDSVTWNDRAHFAIVGATKSQTLEMPWATRQQLAWRIAAAPCKQNALPRPLRQPAARPCCGGEHHALLPDR